MALWVVHSVIQAPALGWGDGPISWFLPLQLKSWVCPPPRKDDAEAAAAGEGPGKAVVEKVDLFGPDCWSGTTRGPGVGVLEKWAWLGRREGRRFELWDMLPCWESTQREGLWGAPALLTLGKSLPPGATGGNSKE